MQHHQPKEVRKIFSENLQRCLTQHQAAPKGQGRVRSVASLFQISQTAAQKWLSGDCLPTLERLHQVAQYFQCSIDALLSPNNTIASEQAETESAELLLATQKWLQQHHQNHSLQSLKIIVATGAAMWPTIPHHSACIVWTELSYLDIDHAIYALSYPSSPQCLLRRVTLGPAQTAHIHCDNSSFACCTHQISLSTLQFGQQPAKSSTEAIIHGRTVAILKETITL